MRKPKDTTQKISDQDFNKVLHDIHVQGLKHCLSPQEAKKHNDHIQRRKSEKYWTEAYEQSNLPPLFYDFTKYNEEVYKFVEKNIKNSVCLVSKTSGLCKTRTIIYFAEQCYLSYAKTVKFYTAMELARKISQAAYKDNKLIKELCNVDLLIIDDLAKHKSTERSDEGIFEIIDYRYLRKLPTWISTNYLGTELEEKFGDKGPYLVRRISEEYQIWPKGKVGG